MATSESEVQGFQTKWRDLLSAAQAQKLPSSAVGQVYQLDLQHLQSGYQLSKAEAFAAIQSAAAGQPITPTAQQPFSAGAIPGYVGTDLKNFGVGLLGLVKKGIGDVVHPAHIESQVSALWRDPNVVRRPLGDLLAGLNPADGAARGRALYELGHSPLIGSLLPGAADVGDLFNAQGGYRGKAGWEQLAEQPFTSTLDVLPDAAGATGVARRLARAGLDEDARAAAEAAGKIRPSDTSAQAAAARQAAREAVPGGLRRAAAVNQGGVFGLANRLVMDAPFRSDTVGAWLAHKITSGSRGQLGPVAAGVGRLLQETTRAHATALKDVVSDLEGFYREHGLAGVKERADFAWLLTHYRDDWQTAYAGRFDPAEVPHLERAVEDYDTRAQQLVDADLARDRLAAVTDPRDGHVEIRAVEGADRRVVAAHSRYLRARRSAQETAFALADTTGRAMPLDPREATAVVAGHLADSLVHPLGRLLQLRPGAPRALEHVLTAAWTGPARRLIGPSGLLARLGAALNAGNLARADELIGTIIPILRSDRTHGELAGALPAFEDGRRLLRRFTSPRTQKTLAGYAQARARLEQALDRSPEGRLQPRMTELVTDRLLAHLDGKAADIPDVQLLYDQVANGLWHGQRFVDVVGAGEWNRIVNSAMSELRREQADGLSPRFVYSTRHEELGRLGAGRMDLERIRTSRTARSRGRVNPTAVYDPVLGLLRKQAEDLQEQVTTELFYGQQGILARWGTTVDDINALALQLVKEPEGGTLATRGQLIDRWKRENFREFDPRQFIVSKAPTSGFAPTSALHLPADVDQAIRANLQAVKAPDSVAKQVFNRGTRVFRYTLLNFSPRYQAHIWLGGSMLMALGAPGAFRYLPAAAGMMVNDSPSLLRLAAHPTLGAPLRPVFDWLRSRAVKQGEHGLPAQISHELPEGDPQDLLNAWNYAGGRKLAGWYQQLAKARGVTDAGMELATFGANLLRSAVYLAGKHAGGEAEGVRLALKVFADMDGMTPMERSIIKYVMPFYGWTRHILRFTATLPADHPWRAAVISQLVNQEWADWNSGIPKSMMYLLQLGGIGPDGTVTALDVRQLDPLRSVSDVFTLGGFVSSLNPAWQTVVSAFGIDPSTGGPEDLYPTMTLDQFYGSEKAASSQNIGTVLAQGIGSYVPEASIADHFLALSSYTRWAKANNHQAYMNQLWSALNFPWVPQQVNLQQVVARTELDRYQVAKDQATAAMNDPNPNSPTWKQLLSYSYVPYQGWMVQPWALRQWAFDQVVRAGFWNGSVGTLPPSQVVTPPSAPNI